MIEISNIQKRVIRNHYDVSTLFYRLLWGPHIHHGYWTGDETVDVAQVELTKRLASLAGIQRDSNIYDIGCGMGGSSQWLAKNLGGRVTGVTLSPVQKYWATASSAWNRIQPRPRFLWADAESMAFDSESANYVWSVECTEHLFDKPAFFRKAASWLRPGGRFAICAWLAGIEPLSTPQKELVVRVCEGMFCPSLGTEEDYLTWFEQAGMKIVHRAIWTRQVERTWEICKRRIDRTGVRYLARALGKNHVLFLNHFDSILSAYRTGAMEYGAFVAEKGPRSI